MSAKNDLHAEMAALRADLSCIPLDRLSQELRDAETRVEVANKKYREHQNGKSNSDFATDITTEFGKADSAKRKALNSLEVANRDALRAKQRIDTIERMLVSGDRITGAHDRLAALRDTAAANQHDLDRIDAAKARLEGMRSDAQTRLVQFSDVCADQLLIDAGLPGEVAAQPKSNEVTKTQQELATIDRAIEKVDASRTGHLEAMKATDRETREVQEELLYAISDKAALDHATALGEYLPFLAALRRAEMSASGCKISPSVDVEMLAGQINTAAND